MAQTQRDDLEAIASVEAAQYSKILSGLEAAEPTIRLSAIIDILRMSLPPDVAASLLRWTLFLRTVVSSPFNAKPAEQAIQEVSRTLEVQVPDEIVSLISKISETDIIHAVWKAQTLSRDAEHLYQGFSIIIDRRPVFNKSQTEIVGDVIMPFLKISYVDGGETRNASISIDSRDIETIYREIEKLRRKLNVIASNSDPRKSFLVGEEVEFGSL